MDPVYPLYLNRDEFSRHLGVNPTHAKDCFNWTAWEAHTVKWRNQISEAWWPKAEDNFCKKVGYTLIRTGLNIALFEIPLALFMLSSLVDAVVFACFYGILAFLNQFLRIECLSDGVKEFEFEMNFALKWTPIYGAHLIRNLYVKELERPILPSEMERIIALMESERRLLIRLDRASQQVLQQQ